MKLPIRNYWKKNRHVGFSLLAFLLVFTPFSANAQQNRLNTGALLELSGNKIYTGAGQAGILGFDGFENYWNVAPADQKPVIFMDYYDLYNIGPDWTRELKQELLKFHRDGYYVIPQIGLTMEYGWAENVANGQAETELTNFIEGFKYLGIPVFLRIGYEFNIDQDGNGSPVDKTAYKAAFREIVTRCRNANLEVASVWCCSLEGAGGIWDWYPGDDVVDWLSFDTFGGNTIPNQTILTQLVDEAENKNKPVLVGEASPRTVNGVSYKTWSWYENYFTIIEGEPSIKQMCYINWDWDIQDMIGGNGLFPWGDSRLQMPGSVKDQYFARMDNSFYFHATTEIQTRQLFDYSDNSAPARVTNLRRVGDNLLWDASSDVGQAGIAHYSIYKDGQFWDYIIGTKYPVQDLYYGNGASIQVTAMDKAGNESSLSNSLNVDLKKSINLIWDGEFDLPQTSVALGWRFMGSMDGNAKPAPDDLSGSINSNGLLSGQNCAELTWDQQLTKDWKIQLFQGFQVIQGEQYTISFQGMAEIDCQAKLYFMDHHVDPLHTHIPSNGSQDPPWMDSEWQIYDSWVINLTTQPQTFEFTSTAPVTETARLSLMFGETPVTTVWVDAFAVTAGLNLALPVANAGPDQVVLDANNDGKENVTFDGSGSTDADGSIVSYVWEENGTQLATGVNPTVQLDKKEYTITLTVTDNDGNTDSDELVVLVTDGTPVAKAGVDQNLIDLDGNGQESVTLDGSASTDPDGSISSFAWKESGSTIANGEIATVSLAAGTHAITLEVTDNDGKKATDDVVISILEEIGQEASVTASSTSAGSTNNINDGDDQNEWVSGDNSGTEWVMFDFGQSRDIKQVNIDWSSKYGIEYEVQVSDNSTFSTLTTLASVTDGDGGEDTHVASSNISGRYLRVHATKGSGGNTGEFIHTSGDFRAVVGGTSSTTVTFEPLKTGIGTSFIYINVRVNDSQNNDYYQATANSPYTINNVSAGDIVHFRYKYAPDGKGSQTIMDDFYTFEVGNIGVDNTYSINEIKVYGVSTGTNISPIANAGPDQTVADADDNGSESVTLDGTGSSDPDGNIISYIWKENNSQIATGPNPTVTLTVATHVITLEVTDNGGAVDTDQVTIVVSSPANLPPVADAGPDQTVTDSDNDGKELVTIDGSNSYDPDGTIVNYLWGDGIGPAVVGSPVEQFDLDVGTHTITLTVVDNDGAQDSDEVTVVVNSAPIDPPVADFTADITTVQEGGSVTFTDQSTNSPYSWSWNFQGGDPAISVAQTPTITYNSPGVYDVTLTATNSGGSDTETKTGYITVTTGGDCIATFPYNEGFESGLGDFTQETGDDIDWTRQSGGTPSNSTGPSGAAGGTFYMYVESSNPNYPDKVANLLSPCFDLTSVTTAQLEFQYHMLGNAVGTLNVQVSTNGGSSWTTIWTKSGTQGSSWNTATVNLSAYVGQADVSLRFNGTTADSWQGDICIDDISISEGGVIDPPVADFTANITTVEEGGSVTFTDLSTNSPTTWSWSFPGGIPSSSAQQSPTVTYNTAGTYNVTLTATNAGGSDDEIKNSYITVTSSSDCISSFPFAEGFESGLGDFTQASGDDIDWTRQSGGTPSNNTGPSGAAVGTYYMYVEASDPNYPTKVANLLSPCFDFGSLNSPELEFQYHMLGDAVGTLNVQVSTNSGSSWTTVWTKSATQGSSWNTATVSLDTYEGEADVSLRFNGTTSSSWQGDICIDDISIDEGISTNCPDTHPFECGGKCYVDEAQAASDGCYPNSPELVTKSILAQLNNVDNTSFVYLYPNPTKSSIKIVGISETTEYSIYNIYGKVLYKGTGTKIDVSEYAPGIYFILTEVGDNMRFIKK